MKPKLRNCPVCCSSRLKLLRSDFTFKLRNKVVVVPKLERYECAHCGEVFFDYEGIKRLEEA